MNRDQLLFSEKTWSVPYFPISLPKMSTGTASSARNRRICGGRREGLVINRSQEINGLLHQLA